jgi:hypothetical protein
MAGAQDQITSVAYEAAKEIAEHIVLEHGLPPVTEPKAEAADELKEWLKKVAGNDDLIEYAPVLKNEGFTSLESIKKLSEEDFDAMKITKRGHRKVLLAAVNELNGKKA